MTPNSTPADGAPGGPGADPPLPHTSAATTEPGRHTSALTAGLAPGYPPAATVEPGGLPPVTAAATAEPGGLPPVTAAATVGPGGLPPLAAAAAAELGAAPHSSATPPTAAGPGVLTPPEQHADASPPTTAARSAPRGPGGLPPVSGRGGVGEASAAPPAGVAVLPEETGRPGARETPARGAGARAAVTAESGTATRAGSRARTGTAAPPGDTDRTRDGARPGGTAEMAPGAELDEGGSAAGAAQAVGVRARPGGAAGTAAPPRGTDRARGVGAYVGEVAAYRPGALVPYQPRRIEGLLLGLAAGDAAGWPAARHRAARMPEWTRRLTRELDTFAEQNATTTLPVPIALNQPPEPLRLGPSDDAEWAAFTAESVLTAAGALLSDLGRSRRMRAAIDLAWNALASEVAAAAERAPEVESAVLPLRARISVRAGLGNLAKGLRPPATGHDNPHYFDDAACVRAVVLAVVHPGDPSAAAGLADFDARYTQDGDGVHGARAMAAAVAAALGGANVDTAVDAALAQLPGSTEIGRNARHAVKLARTTDGAFALVPLLEHEIVDHVYSYGIAAAETVPVALALATAARGRVTEAVPAAACLSRVADSAPALAGALTGAIGGGESLPATWREACRTLSGCALPRLAGTDLVELAELLVHTELTTPEG